MTVTRPLRAAPAGTTGRHRPIGWWGMSLAITTEAMLFAGLLSSYFYLRAHADEWPMGGIEPPELLHISIFTAILLGSSGPVSYAERAVGAGHLGRTRAALATSFLMGSAFLAFTMWEFFHAKEGLGENAYASVFHTTVGLHALHVFVGLLMSIGVQLKLWTGRIDADRHLTLRLYAMYWHFVDAVWVVVFSSLYLSVRWSP